MNEDSQKLVERFRAGDFTVLEMARIAIENPDVTVQRILSEYGSMVVKVGLLKNPRLDPGIRALIEEHLTLVMEAWEELEESDIPYKVDKKI